jgi:esterase/lipase superfamily enzyme
MAYLMSAPLAFPISKADASTVSSALDRPNRMTLLYATSRRPAGVPAARKYTEAVSDELRLGVATLRIAYPDTTARDLRALPPVDGPRDRPELQLENLDERAVVGARANLQQLSAEAASFFADVDRALAASADKDLFVYVHGVNNSVYRTAAQAAQYWQLTGRDSVVVAFVWPTVDNFLNYSTDLRNARRSVPAFGRFIELLAQHTKAEHINILAHSAGAQIVSPALAALGGGAAGPERAELRKRMRLGELYYAAADIGLKAFVQDLRQYVDLPLRVTLQRNSADFVLALAAFSAGNSRAGRPDLDELSPDERRSLLAWVAESRLDVVDVASERAGDLLTGAHAFWYERRWVSSDVVLEFLYHAPPEARGLQKRMYKDDLSFWAFPSDYEQRVTRAIRRLQAE